MTQSGSEQQKNNVRARSDYETLLSDFSSNLITTYVDTGRYDELYQELERMEHDSSPAAVALSTDFETQMMRNDITTDLVLCMYGSPGYVYPGDRPGPMSEFDRARRHDAAETTLDLVCNDDDFWISSQARERLEYLHERDPRVYYEIVRGLIRRHPSVEPNNRATHATTIATEVGLYMLEDIDFWLTDEGMDLINAIYPITPVLHSEIIAPLYERAQFMELAPVVMARLERTMGAALGQRGAVFERYFQRFADVLYERYVRQGDLDGVIELIDRYREQGANTPLAILCDEFEARVLRTNDGYLVARHLLTLSQDVPTEIEEPEEPQADKEDPFQRVPKPKKIDELKPKEVAAREAQEAAANEARRRFDILINFVVDDEATFEYPTDREPRIEQLMEQDDEIYFEIMRVAARRVSDPNVEDDYRYVLTALRAYGGDIERIGPHYEYWGSTDGMEVLSDLYFRDRELYISILENLSRYCRRTPSPQFGYAQFFDCQLAIYREFEEESLPECFELLRLPSMGEVITNRMNWMFEPPPPIQVDGVGNIEWVRWFNDREVLLRDKRSLTRTLSDMLPPHPDVLELALADVEAVYYDHHQQFASQRERQMLRQASRFGGYYYGRVSSVMSDRVEAVALSVPSPEIASRAVVACLAGILEHSHQAQADDDIAASFETAENVMELSDSQKEQLKRVEKILLKLPSWRYVITGDQSAKYTHNALAFFRTLETRGMGVTVKITPKGLVVHNPLHQQGKLVDGEKEDKGKKVREDGGGDDYTVVKWADIAEANIDIDFSPITDLAMNVVSKTMLVTDGRVGEPAMENILRRGPGTIKFDMKGRETPLLELPPVKYPRVFADLLQELAKIFSHSPRDGMALIAHLSGAEVKK